MMNIEHLTLANTFWTWLACYFKGKGLVCIWFVFGGLGRSVGYVLGGAVVLFRGLEDKSEYTTAILGQRDLWFKLC